MPNATDRIADADFAMIRTALNPPERPQMATLREQWTAQARDDGRLIGLRAGFEGPLTVRFPEVAEGRQERIRAWQDADAMAALLEGLTRVKSLAAAKRLIAAGEGKAKR